MSSREQASVVVSAVDGERRSAAPDSRDTEDARARSGGAPNLVAVGDAEAGTRPAAARSEVADATAPDAPPASGRRSRRDKLRYLLLLVLNDTAADHAAVLTFYGVLSALPVLFALAVAVGALHPSSGDSMERGLREFGPGIGADTLVAIIGELRNTPPPVPLVVLIVPVALWVLARYVAALMRAVRHMYGIADEKPTYRTLLVRLGVVLTGVPLLGLTLAVVMVTGEFALRVSERFGYGRAVSTAWPILKWPLLVCVMIAFVVGLYKVVLRGHGTRYRRLARGSLLAVTIWVAASVGFDLYLTHFDSYNRIYGSLAGAIVLLTWMWFTHLALLLGAAYNAPDPPMGRAEDTTMSYDAAA